MSKKHKHRHHPASTSSQVELRPRIERARQEGRFQQALELAKQLHKYEPSPDHLELLKEVYLGRARQLHSQGQTRDALTVLDVAAHLDSTTPTWLQQLAEEMALCGDVAGSLALIEKLPDTVSANRILPQAVDAAVQLESAGRASLPPALQADFDRILAAFAHVEAGRDEEMRQALQGIGLRSPFLEWKLLLRGLQAYWQNDDPRAVENWQRLTPEHVPARLAAPFRFRIDPAFRGAQAAAAQNALQKQVDRLQGSPLLTNLRTLQATMANKNKMSTAFRQAEALLPALRQEAPHLASRLAWCFYWTVMETGPDDLRRYQRVFGQPPDDLNFHRLQALAYERGGDLTAAHKHWQHYEKEIADHHENWPSGQADRARALIWQRMGRNAASIPQPSRRERRPSNLPFDLDEPEAPLNPPAEKCLQKSLELAADLLESHEELFCLHLEAKRDNKAEKAARQLLQHFPDHVPTLERLGDLRRRHGDYAEALALLQQAMAGHAIDRRLRRKASDLHVLLGHTHVEGNRFDEARREFQSALELSNGEDGSMVLAHWAACEFKAGETARAEELLQQALAQTLAPVGVAFLLLTEVLRLKLDRALKKRFEQDLKTGLAEPTEFGAVFLSRILAGLHSGGVQYLGQKSHTQKLLSYINKSRDLNFAESRLEELCRNLLDLQDYPKARRFAEVGEMNYPNNPAFPYLHALGWLRANRRQRPSPMQISTLLKRAKSLLQGQPPNESRDRMLEDIDKHLSELNPFGLELLTQLFGFDMDDDDDDGW